MVENIKEVSERATVTETQKIMHDPSRSCSFHEQNE